MDEGSQAAVGGGAGGAPDERPQQRREYSGAGSTLGLAALVILAVGLGIWFFELRGGDGGGGQAKTPGLGILPTAAGQNRTGQALAAREGRVAPNFKLATLDGGAVTLADYRGKHVLVNFWASWCGPCRGETPDLQALAEKAASGGRLVVVGVNQQETAAAARAFVSQFGVTYPVALDRTGEVSEAYRIGRGLPISLLLDPEGVVTRIYLGRLGSNEIAALAREFGS